MELVASNFLRGMVENGRAFVLWLELNLGHLPFADSLHDLSQEGLEKVDHKLIFKIPNYEMPAISAWLPF